MEALESGREDQAGFEGDGSAAHYWGVCGEMAYAKARNVYYAPTFEAFHSPDVDGVGVRTRTEHWHELIIRPSDPDDLFFVLVTVEALVAPAIFRVYDAGMLAAEAKTHKEWLKPYGGRPPAYFVPQARLRPRPPLSLELAMPPVRMPVSRNGVLTALRLGATIRN
jgi:hypothetical protein